MNPLANTPIKKQSVISNNKPNCNATKDNTTQKDERVSDSEEKKSVENLEISKDETKVPKREKTPDIISGAVIQKPKDNMEPQVMMNEEDEPSNDKSEGEEIKVKLIEIDRRTGKFRLSRKALLPKPEKKD